jgi:hypothetical protein
MISDQQKRKAKERVTTELKKTVAIAAYLWVILSLLEIYRFAILRGVTQASISTYRIGFAAINALIVAHFIGIGETIHLGESLRQKRVIYSVLFKSVIFALFVICCDVIEEVISGLIHGTSIRASVPRMGGGGLLGMVLVGIIVSIVLIPFFLYTELRGLIDYEKLHSLIFQKRPRVDAA